MTEPAETEDGAPAPDADLSIPQSIRLAVLGSLIHLEGAPVFKAVADFKGICADAAQWVETGVWPLPPPAATPKLKRVQ